MLGLHGAEMREQVTKPDGSNLLLLLEVHALTEIGRLALVGRNSLGGRGRRAAVEKTPRNTMLVQ